MVLRTPLQQSSAPFESPCRRIVRLSGAQPADGRFWVHQSSVTGEVTYRACAKSQVCTERIVEWLKWSDLGGAPRARDAATRRVDRCLASLDLGPVNKTFVRGDCSWTRGPPVQRRLDLEAEEGEWEGKGGNPAQIEGCVCICISAMILRFFRSNFARGRLHADRILSTLG